MKIQEEWLESESGLDMEQNNSSTIYPNAEVRVEKAQFSILHLRRLCVERKEIIISPDFQRNDVWKGRQASELIESILMGIPIPIMYLFEAKDGKKQVVDGRQRINTILSFLKGGFKLKDLKILHALNGCAFTDLDLKLQGIFEDYQLFFYIIQPPTPERVKYDIFDRVNRGGTRLNNQEMRNALYQGKSTVLLKELAESCIFKEVTEKSISPQRMKDTYVVLRFLTFYIWKTQKAIDKDGIWIDYKSDMNDFLAKTMEYINDLNDSQIENLKNIFLDKEHIKVKQDGEYTDDFDIEFNKIEDKKNEKTYEIKLKRLKVDGKFKIKMDEGTLIDEGGLENNLFEVDVYLEMENVEEKDNYLKDEIKEEKIEKSEEFEYENDEEQFEDI